MKKQTFTVTGKLQIVEKLKNSTNGNPKYLACVVHDDYTITTFYTATDCSHGYSITNHEGKDVEIEIKPSRGKWVLQSIKEV